MSSKEVQLAATNVVISRRVVVVYFDIVERIAKGVAFVRRM